MEYKIEKETYINWRKAISEMFSEEKISGNEKELSGFIDFLLKEKIAPYYYYKCKERIEDEKVKTKLKNIYFHFLGANEILRMKSEFIIKRINEIGIVPVILKGIELQDNLYPKPELRPSSDLDILVLNQKDFDLSLNELLKMGYRIYEYRSIKFPMIYGKDLVLIPPESNGLMVELHHSLRFGKCDRRRKYDEIFYTPANLVIRNNGKIKYYGFSNEANYAYLSHHTFQSHHNLKRLIWVLDLLLLRDRLDQKRIKEIAEESNTKELIDFSYKLLDAILLTDKNSDCFISEVQSNKKSALIKLKNEFKNIDGISKKLLWLLIWFFPNKVFLKKRYGEKKNIFSLYLTYYTKLLKRLFEASWGEFLDK
ncbi:MAG: nucleotidyltransferase family protein [Acidobacteriota bacterium]